MWRSVLGALALMLVLEGFMPLFSPRRWRRMVQEAMRLSDGQLRFLGLSCVLGGVLLLVMLAA